MCVCCMSNCGIVIGVERHGARSIFSPNFCILSALFVYAELSGLSPTKWRHASACTVGSVPRASPSSRRRHFCVTDRPTLRLLIGADRARPVGSVQRTGRLLGEAGEGEAAAGAPINKYHPVINGLPPTPRGLASHMPTSTVSC